MIELKKTDGEDGAEAMDMYFDFCYCTDVALIYFNAGWCTACKPVQGFLEEFEAEFPYVSVMKVDTDKFGEIAMAENVNGLPFFVMYCDGVKKGQMHGLVSKHELKAWALKTSCLED